MTNLLPQKKQKTMRQERRLRIVVVVLVFLLSVEVLGVLGLLPSILLLRSKKKSVTSELGTLETLVARREEDNANAVIRTTNEELSRLAAVVRNTPATIDILYIAELAGEEVRVDGLDYRSTIQEELLAGTSTDSTLVKMVTVRGVASTRDTFLAFVRRLEKEGFGDIEFPVSNLAAKTDIPFSLTLTISPVDQ